MNGIKDFFDSLNKMTNVKLNISVLITCLSLMLLSSPQEFILDPVPKIIPQSLILITSIRLIFSLLNAMHNLLSKIKEKRDKRKNEQDESIKKEEQRVASIESVKEILSNLDVFQLYIIKELKGKNHSTHDKGAALFSLINNKIVFPVATGERSQSIALTKTAKEIIKNEYNESTIPLEIKAAKRVFSSMEENDLTSFDALLKNDTISTTWSDRNGSTRYTPLHRTYAKYKKSIIFQQSQTGDTYSLNPDLRDTLKDLIEKIMPAEESVSP